MPTKSFVREFNDGAFLVRFELSAPAPRPTKLPAERDGWALLPGVVLSCGSAYPGMYWRHAVVISSLLLLCLSTVGDLLLFSGQRPQQQSPAHLLQKVLCMPLINPFRHQLYMLIASHRSKGSSSQPLEGGHPRLAWHRGGKAHEPRGKSKSRRPAAQKPCWSTTPTITTWIR